MIANTQMIDWDALEIEPIMEHNDHEFVNFKGIDPLVISCMMFRSYKGSSYVISVDADYLSHKIEKITPEDIAMAKEIRHYYSARYLTRELKNNSLTEYKRAVINFFSHKDFYSFPEKYLGIVNRLPSYYDYDTKLKRMFDEHSSDLSSEDLELSDYTLTLTYLQTLHPVTKRDKGKHFWFKDNEGRMFMFNCKTPNPFLSLFESYVQHKGIVKINIGSKLLLPKTTYQFSYFQLPTNVEFIYE